MPTVFSRKDVAQLKDVLKYHPDGPIVAKTIDDLMDLQDLANNLKYPINSVVDLEKQLGTDKLFKIREREINVSDLHSFVPAYYFPIGSEEDFFSKASELMKTTKTISMIGITPSGLEAKPNIFEARPDVLEALRLTIGQEVSSQMGPALPECLLQMTPPAQIPSSGVVGLTKEQMKAILPPADIEKLAVLFKETIN